MLKNLKKKKKGFTLIELIIVIAIIAILAALALPKFSSVRESANIKSDIANGKTIYSAVVSLIGEDKVKTPSGNTAEVLEVVNTQAAAGGSLTDKQEQQNLIVEYLDGVPKGKSKTAKGNNFVVRIDVEGNVKVYLKTGNDEGCLVYPNTDGAIGSKKPISSDN